MVKYYIWITACLLFVSCKQTNPTSTASKELPIVTKTDEIDYDISQWKEIKSSSSGILLDIRYATDNNFTEKQIYPCGRCFLRPELAAIILKLQRDISKRYNLGLKLFDCYRPGPAQQRLWDIVPNPSYVTPPAKGSMHTRGLAIDLTLVDSLGSELDMGTEYDFFGIEAHPSYKGHSEQFLTNRKVLAQLMDLHGLSPINTEWWHYSLKTSSYPLSEWEWPCSD